MKIVTLYTLTLSPDWGTDSTVSILSSLPIRKSDLVRSLQLAAAEFVQKVALG
jgi:hypothetical protein